MKSLFLSIILLALPNTAPAEKIIEDYLKTTEVNRCPANPANWLQIPGTDFKFATEKTNKKEIDWKLVVSLWKEIKKHYKIDQSIKLPKNFYFRELAVTYDGYNALGFYYSTGTLYSSSIEIYQYSFLLEYLSYYKNYVELTQNDLNAYFYHVIAHELVHFALDYKNNFIRNDRRQPDHCLMKQIDIKLAEYVDNHFKTNGKIKKIVTTLSDNDYEINIMCAEWMQKNLER